MQKKMHYQNGADKKEIKALQCNTNVQKCNTEIEKEIDIEIELENKASHCDTNVQKSDIEIE